MNKDRKKELRKKYAQEQKGRLEESLPFDKTMFARLFDYLDKSLQSQGCDNTLKHTGIFLQNSNLPIDRSISWLQENGGFCDCEVLANIEDKISEL